LVPQAIRTGDLQLASVLNNIATDSFKDLTNHRSVRSVCIGPGRCSTSNIQGVTDKILAGNAAYIKTLKSCPVPDPSIIRSEVEKYAELKTLDAEIDNLVKVPINDHQRLALESLAMQIGVPGFAGSSLLKVLNSGQYNKASDEFRKWNLPAPIICRREVEISIWNGA